MPVTTDPNELAQKSLFRQLTNEQLTHIHALLHGKAFPAGTNILTAEQPGEVVYMIDRGAVKIHIEQQDGSDVILAILVAGDVLGEMSSMDAAARSASAITLEDSVLWWIERQAFRQCVKTMPELAANLLSMLSLRLRMANEQIQALATKDVEGRVARQLLSLAKMHGQPQPNGDVVIPYRLTQSDLASFIGATRERVNAVVASYKQRKYLSVDKAHRFTLHNQEALSKRVQSGG